MGHHQITKLPALLGKRDALEDPKSSVKMTIAMNSTVSLGSLLLGNARGSETPMLHFIGRACARRWREALAGGLLLIGGALALIGYYGTPDGPSELPQGSSRSLSLEVPDEFSSGDTTLIDDDDAPGELGSGNEWPVNTTSPRMSAPNPPAHSGPAPSIEDDAAQSLPSLSLEMPAIVPSDLPDVERQTFADPVQTLSPEMLGGADVTSPALIAPRASPNTVPNLLPKPGLLNW